MSDAGHMSGGKPIVPLPPEEERYTLEEARAHLSQMECVELGHAYSFVTSPSSPDPILVLCDRCFKSWEMVQK